MRTSKTRSGSKKRSTSRQKSSQPTDTKRKKKTNPSKKLSTTKSSTGSGKNDNRRRKSSVSKTSKGGTLARLRNKLSRRSAAAGTSSGKDLSAKNKPKQSRKKGTAKSGTRRYKSKTKNPSHSGPSISPQQEPPTSKSKGRKKAKSRNKKSKKSKEDEKLPDKISKGVPADADKRSETTPSVEAEDEKKKPISQNMKPMIMPVIEAKQTRPSNSKTTQSSQDSKTADNENKLMACSSWTEVAASKKQASRMIIIMRSAERVDRVFGPKWFLTEAPHGILNPTDLNIPNNVITGQLLSNGLLRNNPPITTIGKYSTALAARAMYNRGVQPKLVVCSPTLRAIQTGDEVAKFLRAKLAIEPGLVEPLTWYRRPGKESLDFGLDEISKHYTIDTENYSQIISMESITRLYPFETEAQGLSRVDFVLRSLAGEQRTHPLVVVGHAITLAAAVALACPQRQKTTSNTSPSEITSFDWQMGVHMLEGDVVDQVNLGLRFPPGSVVALKQVNKGPPFLYELAQEVVPPLSYGDFYSNQPVLVETSS